MPAKIEFPINTPVDLALQYAEGRNVPSSFGDGSQVMYSTTDGRRMYLSPTVAAKLAALKPQPGQLLRITKRERANGARGFDWTVEKLGQQADGTFLLPKADGPTPPAGHRPATSTSTHQETAIDSKAITAPERKPAQSEVERHCKRLIDLQSACFEYATQKYGATVSREDVRSIVLSVYIQAGRSGQLRPRVMRRAG